MDEEDEDCSGCGEEAEELWDCGPCGNKVCENCAESCSACGGTLCPSCSDESDDDCGSCRDE